MPTTPVVDLTTRDSHTCKNCLGFKSSIVLIWSTRISNIRDEASTLTTFLTAQVAKFSEVAGTYDLDFGHTLTPTASNSPARRDFISDATKAIDKTVNDFKHLGNFNLDKTETFSVAAGTPNTATNILNRSGVKIDCVNCYTLGKVTLTGHISVGYVTTQLSTYFR